MSRSDVPIDCSECRVEYNATMLLEQPDPFTVEVDVGCVLYVNDALLTDDAHHYTFRPYHNGATDDSR